MQLHHSKHHATYVNNLNIAEDKLKEAVAKGDVNTQIALAPAIKFNGGGHLNHSIFWANLSPSSSKPDGKYSFSASVPRKKGFLAKKIFTHQENFHSPQINFYLRQEIFFLCRVTVSNTDRTPINNWVLGLLIIFKLCNLISEKYAVINREFFIK